MAKISQYIIRFFIFTCVFITNARAQYSCHLNIKWVDADNTTKNSLHLPENFISKEACLQYVGQLPQLLAAKGFISASVDSVYIDTAQVFVHLFTGKKYIWQSIYASDDDWEIIKNAGFSKNNFNDQPFNPAKAELLYSSLLDYFSNNGYPFAKIGLDSFVFNDDKISARLIIDKGNLYYIDSIIISGEIKIAKNFITGFLGIQEHSIYSQQKVNNISKKLAELSFAEQLQQPTVTMLNTGAVINLYLRGRQSNQVNALIGFLPQNAQKGGKLLLTGEASLDLRNAFASGEMLEVNWQQLQYKSPRLNIQVQWPFIFKSAFGFAGSFELYKRDSFFLNIKANAGLQTIISENQRGAVFLQTQSTNVLSVDTNLVKYTKQLPDVADINTISIAMQYEFNNTNYRFNPRSGNEWQASISLGRKKIKRNNSILAIKDPSFNYASLYDTVKQNAYTASITAAAAHYFPLGKQATLKTAAHAGWFQSPNYFKNELYQLGGFKLLRGFDEETIFSNRYFIGTLEYRYLLAQNSYLFTFTDIGVAAYKSISESYSHFYAGAGFGIAFETQTGIFNLSYAIGKRDDQKLDFRQSKIHIGFVSVF